MKIEISYDEIAVTHIIKMNKTRARIMCFYHPPINEVIFHARVKQVGLPKEGAFHQRWDDLLKYLEDTGLGCEPVIEYLRGIYLKTIDKQIDAFNVAIDKLIDDRTKEEHYGQKPG